MRVWVLVVLVLLFGGGVAAAQEASPRVTMQQVLTVDVVYGDTIYEVNPADGPVIVYVESRLETDAGVELSGVVVVRDATGYRVAGEFVDPAPAVYSAAQVGDVLVLGAPAVAQ